MSKGSRRRLSEFLVLSAGLSTWTLPCLAPERTSFALGGARRRRYLYGASRSSSPARPTSGEQAIAPRVCECCSDQLGLGQVSKTAHRPGRRNHPPNPCASVVVNSTVALV